MESDDDMLNVDFDPIELENIDEDALLGGACYPSSPPPVNNDVTEKSSTQPTEYACSNDDKLLQNEPPESVTESSRLTPVNTEQSEIPTTPKLDFDASCTTASSNVNFEVTTTSDISLETETTLASTEISTGALVLPIDSTNETDTKSELDEDHVMSAVSVTEKAPSPNEPKNFSISRDGYNNNEKYRQNSRHQQANERKITSSISQLTGANKVLVNPHFRGHQHGVNMKHWIGEDRKTISGMNVGHSSLINNPSLTPTLMPHGVPMHVIAPHTNLSVPPPPIGMLPPTSKTLPMFSAPPPTLNLANGISVVDTSRPPPAIIAGQQPGKIEWLGATEMFLRKIQLKDPAPPYSGRDSSKFDRKRIIENLHRRYGSGRESPRNRRKSSSSRSKSRSRSYSRSRSPQPHPQHIGAGFSVRKFAPDDKRRQQTSGMENVSEVLYDDDYLRKLDDQRRKREELLRKKEESRLREAERKHNVPHVKPSDHNSTKSHQNDKCTASNGRVVFLSGGNKSQRPSQTSSTSQRLSGRIVLPLKQMAAAAKNNISAPTLRKLVRNAPKKRNQLQLWTEKRANKRK